MKYDGFSVEMTFCLEIQKKNISQILKNKPKRWWVLTAFLPLFQSCQKINRKKKSGKEKKKRLLSWPRFLLLTQAKFPVVQIPSPPFSFQSDKKTSTEVNEKTSELWVKTEKGLQDLS